jgi:hypothetical protein
MPGTDASRSQSVAQHMSVSFVSALFEGGRLTKEFLDLPPTRRSFLIPYLHPKAADARQPSFTLPMAKGLIKLLSSIPGQ